MKKFGPLKLFLLVILVLVLSLAPTLALFFKKDDIIKSEFFGETSELQGVLAVWNVDTFDGGKVGKSVMIDRVSAEFEKQHKGTKVFVENLTQEEYDLRTQNEAPDVICFGSGMWQKVKNKAKNAVFNPKIYENIANSVADGDNCLAFPWALGCYFLLTTNDVLDVFGEEEIDIEKRCFDLGYERKQGKKIKQIFSLTFGGDGVHLPQVGLEQYGAAKAGSVSDKAGTQTPYEAYVEFFRQEASVLFGTHRDFARFENKLAVGAISGIVAKRCNYTDMVQYAVATNGLDPTRVKYAELFCQFLQSDYVQSLVEKWGMIPVVEVKKQGLFGEIALADVNKMNIKKLY